MFVEILKTSVRHDGTLDRICEWNVYDIVLLCVQYMVKILELTKSYYDGRFHKN